MEKRFVLRSALEQAEITQNELARILGVTPGCVSNWASGRKLPSTRYLAAIAAALHCTIDSLFAERAG